MPLAVEQFSPENLRRFLIFCTGGALAAPRGPPRGLRDWCAVPAVLRGPPVAHTCLNKLDLPYYQDQALFVKMFTKAIQECGTSDRV